MAFATYEAALRHLLPLTSVADWGWERRFEPASSSPVRMGKPDGASRLWLNASGLNRQFVQGLIGVDFAGRTVTFIGNNLREGYDEFTEVVRPDPAWWEAVRALDWPVPVDPPTP